MNILDYTARGGEHPNIDIEIIERQIQDEAIKRFLSIPVYLSLIHI